MKTCVRCGRPKDESEFSANKKCKDGLTSWCRECVSKYNAKYRQKKKNISDTQEDSNDTKHDITINIQITVRI